MNVLFIFSRHATDPRDSTLTKDLSDEFAKQGVNVYVMTMLEKNKNQDTSFKLENGYHVLRVKTGNYFNCKTRVEKVKTILTMPNQFVAAAKEYLSEVKFDLIIAHTPFVSSQKIITPLKKMFDCPAHLILWDIFPQNAWDIGIIKNKLLFKYFKRSEVKMLTAYDHIWCMSDGNVDYMKQHYPELRYLTIDRLYNSSQIKALPDIDREQIRSKYGYTSEDIIAIFGGNMGVPQRLENILELAKRAKDIKFLFVGSGTETSVIIELANRLKLDNVQFISQVPRADYEALTYGADIGLVSLDQRFTVPNFPSKTTDYFKLQLPIFASLDSGAAKDYGYFLTDIAKAGRFAQAGDHESVFNEFIKLCSDTNLRKQLGKNGRRFYEDCLSSESAYEKIVNRLNIN